MTEYKCPDCDNEMVYEGGLLWNASLTECFYGFKCPNCGSRFEHRLRKEEEDELKERAKREKEVVSKMKTKELLIKIFTIKRMYGVLIFLVASLTLTIVAIIISPVQIVGLFVGACFCIFMIYAILANWEDESEENATRTKGEQ